jgi:hypothetical protein
MFNETELGRNLAIKFYPSCNVANDYLFEYKHENDNSSSILSKFENIRLRSSVATGTFNPSGHTVAQCNS